MGQKRITIPTNINKVFKQYLTVTRPLNNLTPKEIELLSHLLYLNHLESENFKSEEDKWLKIFSTKSRRQIVEALDINDYDFNNMMTALRKKKVIVNNQVEKYFIPKITEEGFQLVYDFKFEKTK
jgi:hypothetical protein